MKPESNISSSRYAETFAEGDKLFAEHIEDEEVGKHIILKQKIGENISKRLLEVPKIMECEDETIASRIFKCKGIYEKLDKWASATDYDKKKYVDLLCEYKNFLLKYDIEKDAADVQIRIDAIRKAMSKQDEEESNS